MGAPRAGRCVHGANTKDSMGANDQALRHLHRRPIRTATAHISDNATTCLGYSAALAVAMPRGPRPTSAPAWRRIVIGRIVPFRNIGIVQRAVPVVVDPCFLAGARREIVTQGIGLA